MPPAPYQQDAATFIYERNHSLIFARPGTGKSLATLLTIRDWIESATVKRVLIVAPLRVVKTVWAQENAKWRIGLTMEICHGEMSKRERNRAIYSGSDVLVVNFDMLKYVLAANHGCDAVVIDEISKCRAHMGFWNKLIQSAKFKISTGLTGSPTPNNYLSLFGMARAVGIDVYGENFDKWRRRYFYPLDFNQYQWAPLPGTDLLDLLKPYVFTLDDGAVALPPIVRTPIEVELPPDIRKRYDTMRKTSALSDLDIIAGNAGVLSGKLRQIAAGFVYDNAGKPVGFSPWRIEVLADLVDEMQGEPLLVVYEWCEQMEMLRRHWPDASWLGGSSTGDEATIERWNERKLPLLFIHPASAAHGLNMAAGGNSVAWLQPPHDQEHYEQTIGRLRRRDQAAGSVFSYEISACRTLDQGVSERLAGRATAQNSLWEAMKVEKDPGGHGSEPRPDQ